MTVPPTRNLKIMYPPNSGPPLVLLSSPMSKKFKQAEEGMRGGVTSH